MVARATRGSDGGRPSLIERRTVKPALLVLGLALLLSVVLPWIDSRTPYHDQVRRGDVVQLADGITLVPASGWQLASGALVGRARTPVGTTAATQLVHGGVSLYAQAAPFAGTPLALLTRVNEINARLGHARGRAAAMSHRYAVTTRQGVTGAAEDFVGLARQGSVVAFVFPSREPSSSGSQGPPIREGVEIVVSGPSGSISRRRDDIVRMIRSIRTVS